MKYKIEAYARMEFEIEADSESEANHLASHYIDDEGKWDWSFDTIKPLE